MLKVITFQKEVLSKENSKFLHGIIGAIIAKETYHFTDDMFNAVYYHTAGHPEMSKLEKIVYLADKIEPGKNYEGIEEERKLAYQDLDQAVILCLKTKIAKLTKEGKKIHQNTIDTLNYLEKKKQVLLLNNVLSRLKNCGTITYIKE